MDQPGKVANPDCDQLNRENEFWTCMTYLHVLLYAVYAEQICIHTTVPYSACVCDREWAGCRGARRPSSSRETKFSGVKEEREKLVHPFLADYEQDWERYPGEPYSAENADHIPRHT